MPRDLKKPILLEGSSGCKFTKIRYQKRTIKGNFSVSISFPSSLRFPLLELQWKLPARPLALYSMAGKPIQCVVCLVLNLFLPTGMGKSAFLEIKAACCKFT